MGRDWVATCWSLGAVMLPAPALGLVGQLLPGGPPRAVGGLVLVALASVLLGVLGLRRCGWLVPRRSLAATGVAVGAVVVTGLLLADVWHRHGDPVLVVVALALPHVALAALAWPGWTGLVQRVAVATALVGPVGALAFAVGFPLVLLSEALDLPDDGTVGIALAVALGQAVVLVGGTVVARPVGLQRVALPVPALA